MRLSKSAFDKRKREIPYLDTEETHVLRADLKEHNAFLRTLKIGVDLEGAENRWNLAAILYHRVFNGTFDLGGRWYGPFWQSMNEDERAHLTINGEPTYEKDIKCCQPRLLCANAGLDLPFDDPCFDFYRLDGFERRAVKRAFNILVNATNPRQVRGALIEALRKDALPYDGARVSLLTKSLKAAWPQLAAYWHTGIGLRLQRVDADICMRVQAELRHQGIPVLSIHDSFVVRERDRTTLDRVVDQATADACRALSERPLKIGV